MKALEYLREISKVDAKINNEMEELEVLETLATKTTTMFAVDKVRSAKGVHKMADYTERIVEKKIQIRQKIAEWLELKSEAQQLLEKCDADCITLLYKRYFKCESWEQIAMEMNFTYQWVAGGLHKKALSQFQNALDNLTNI